MPLDGGYAKAAEGDCAKGNEWCRGNGSGCRPDQQRSCGKRKGDWYGAKREVRSVDDARALFDAHFSGQNVTVSDIIEKKWCYQADVKNRSGSVIDRVMVDKRFGRIRSIY